MEFKGIEGLPIDPSRLENPIEKPGSDEEASPFQSLMKDMLSTTNDLQVHADQAMESFARGEEKDLHRVMIAINKAELSFRFMMEVRNKMLEAYQEIKNMPV